MTAAFLTTAAFFVFDLTEVWEVKETTSAFLDGLAVLLLEEGVAALGAEYLTGDEFEAHTPQLPPLEQCAHLLQLEHALQ